MRGYFPAGKSYKQFPRSGDADSKADKRFEVMFFREEPLLVFCFLFTQRAFLICSLVSCFQIYLSLPSSSFPASLWFWFSHPLVRTPPVGPPLYNLFIVKKSVSSQKWGSRGKSTREKEKNMIKKGLKEKITQMFRWDWTASPVYRENLYTGFESQCSKPYCSPFINWNLKKTKKN